MDELFLGETPSFEDLVRNIVIARRAYLLVCRDFGISPDDFRGEWERSLAHFYATEWETFTPGEVERACGFAKRILRAISDPEL